MESESVEFIRVDEIDLRSVTFYTNSTKVPRVQQISDIL